MAGCRFTSWRLAPRALLEDQLQLEQAVILDAEDGLGGWLLNAEVGEGEIQRADDDRESVRELALQWDADAARHAVQRQVADGGGADSLTVGGRAVQNDRLGQVEAGGH